MARNRFTAGARCLLNGPENGEGGIQFQNNLVLQETVLDEVNPVSL
jgi:hypothetical protein